MRIHDCADNAERQRHKGNQSKEEREARKTVPFKIFAFRRRNDL